MDIPARAVPIAKDFDGKSYKGVVVPLYLLFRANFELGRGFVVQDCVFDDCNIEGPGVLMPLAGVKFNRCDFGRVDGDMGNLLLKPMGDRVTGAIAVANCIFNDCRFVSLGFTGDDMFLSGMKSVGAPG
jgi:hypothetical protein